MGSRPLDSVVSPSVGDLERATVRVNGVDLAYLACGPGDGPLAVCLHGFPDTAWTWRFLLPRLAAAGFRAVAPFLRGYAPSGVPADGRYQTGALASDANGLHDALGGDGRAVLVGHDWGASAVYSALGHQPDRWSHAVAMAVPPPAALARGFFDYDQLKRSFYMYLFQLPLAEVLVAADDMAFVARLWADWSPGYEDPSFDLARVRESLGAAEHLRAAIGYYRALFDPSAQDPALAEVQAAGAALPPARPLLYLHGRDDGCIGVSLAEAAVSMLQPPSSAVIVDGAGHFLHLERPDEVGERVVAFVSS
jgi:pimeloyl-ACP methyl ester carboxylesterase